MPLTFRREELVVESAFLERAVFFFVAVPFLSAAFFRARFFGCDFLLEVCLDFVAFLPFFLVAIFAV